MKVYFSVSLSRLDAKTRQNCEQIVKKIKDMGHTVISDTHFKKEKPHYKAQSDEESLKAQKNLTKLKKQADIVVFEVTKPTIAIGQEISYALTLNKPVIVCFQDGEDPHILRDAGGDLLISVPYSKDDLEDGIEDAFTYASENQDVRFNFFISPRIGNYLDWISQSRKVPRSVYLRNLIQKDMAKHPEYE